MYSGPSGHAATMRTSDPNSTARPSVDRTRPSQVAPSETSEASLTSSSSVSPSPAVSGASVPGTVDAVEIGEATIWKENVPDDPTSPVGSVTAQATLHDPAGIGSRMSTVRVRLSSLRIGWPIAVNGLLLHETETWLAEPTSPSKRSTICSGGVVRSAPSAGSLSSSWASWAPARPASSSSAPRTAASAATTSRSVQRGTPVRADTTGPR